MQPPSPPHTSLRVLFAGIKKRCRSVGACLKRSRAYKTQGAGGGRELQYLRERQYFIIPPCRMAVRSLPNLYRCCVERPFSRKLFSADHSRLLPSLDSPFLFLIKENERFDVTEMQFLREGMTVKSSKRSRLSGRRRTPEKLEVVFDWINRPFFLSFLSFFFSLVFHKMFPAS